MPRQKQKRRSKYQYRFKEQPTLWTHWCNAIHGPHLGFSQQATFFWFVLRCAGLAVAMFPPDLRVYKSLLLMLVAQTKRTRLVIPADTYSGQNGDVVTTSLPVVAYTTAQMSDDDAYLMTRTYWEQRDAMASNAAWWAAVSPDMLANIGTEIHPGAIRYYEEANMVLEDHHR